MLIKYINKHKSGTEVDSPIIKKRTAYVPSVNETKLNICYVGQQKSCGLKILYDYKMGVWRLLLDLTSKATT